MNNQWRTFEDSINPEHFEKLDQYAEEIKKDGIISIPNFFEQATANAIWNRLENYNKDWLQFALRPDENQKAIYTYSEQEKNEVLPKIEEGKRAGIFSHSFKRSRQKTHRDTCVCIACRLHKTVLHPKIRNFIATITEQNLTRGNEFFYSRYEDRDFLTMHSDPNAGQCTVILGFTKGWKPEEGGILHFWDEKRGGIYRSFVPSFNTLTIFKLDTGRKMSHFVTRVDGPKKRHSFTGWYG